MELGVEQCRGGERGQPVESGAFEVLADDVTRQVKAGLSADLAALYPQLAAA